MSSGPSAEAIELYKREKHLMYELDKYRLKDYKKAYPEYSLSKILNDCFYKKVFSFIPAKINILELLCHLIVEGNAPLNVRYTLISFFHPYDVFDLVRILSKLP
jgi:hypothetical protein